MNRLLLIAFLLAAACDQKDDTGADAAAAALSAILPPIPTPSSSPSPTPTPIPIHDAGVGACDAGDCPLQGWMKQIWPHMKANDYEGTAELLERCAKLAPENAKTAYPNWVSISLDGANAARAADMEAVKAACRGCHEQYKDKYRAELRARPLPP
ncbi:MAG TPA: hypothetical protein VGH28_32640 [Polyangiaceae bacterium]|jgi:hypothetical protein